MHFLKTIIKPSNYTMTCMSCALSNVGLVGNMRCYLELLNNRIQINYYIPKLQGSELL